jgi:hypothetical protein
MRLYNWAFAIVVLAVFILVTAELFALGMSLGR